MARCAAYDSVGAVTGRCLAAHEGRRLHGMTKKSIVSLMLGVVLLTACVSAGVTLGTLSLTGHLDRENEASESSSAPADFTVLGKRIERGVGWCYSYWLAGGERENCIRFECRVPVGKILPIPCR